MNIVRLLRAVYHALHDDQDFRVLLVLLLSLLAGATSFYWQVEGWSVVDSLYFSVMTMSTIGYGDLAPTKAESKLFTVVFAVLSIGVFAAVAGKIVAVIVRRKHERASRHGHSRKHDGGGS